ncbi:MAG: DUF971 domain-containing protein [Planctomycetota bacterium]
MSASCFPTKLEKPTEASLRIEWSDGKVTQYHAVQLRQVCPCATCREQRSAPPAPPNELPVITKAEAQPVQIEGMRPVGNYAYAIAFSDGHDTGIFTLEFLRELGEAIRDSPSNE